MLACSLCILPLSSLFLHLQYNVKYNRSGQTVQADDQNDSGQLVDPRQNQISISQCFRKLLIFRQSLRKRKAKLKHSKTDHNKSVQSEGWRSVFARLHQACMRAPLLSLHLFSLCVNAMFFLHPNLNYMLIKLHVGMFAVHSTAFESISPSAI